MRSQVNLLNKLPPPWVPKLSFVRVLQGCGIFALLLLSLHLTDVMSLGRAQKKLTALESKRSFLSKQVIVLTQSSGKSIKAPSRQALYELKQELETKKQLAQVVRHYHLGDGVGFSSWFIGLAQSTQVGVWLKSITLEKGGDTLTLKGFALRSDLVTMYLNTLLSNPQYKNISFNMIDIKQAQYEKKSAVSFVASSKSEQSEEASDER